MRLADLSPNPWTVTPQVVLFLDLHNYSLVARELGARQYEFLQAVYTRLGDRVVAYGGALVKYLGDGLLCLFPVTAVGEAVQCAVALRRDYAALVSEWPITTPTEAEVGLALGAVAVGEFGHPTLRQRDVLGEAVNKAAVIGHHRGIALTAAVYAALQGQIALRLLPPMPLKWRDTPLARWEVVEESPPWPG